MSAHPPEPPHLVGVADVERARAALVGAIRPTPVRESPSVSAACGRRVLLKPEHLQRTGSFKVRGATNLVSALPPDVGCVVAASAGNHAQGVAVAAQRSGRRSVVFMPETVSLPKAEATAAYGAEVRLVGLTVEEAIDAAAELAEREGAVLVPPFDHPAVIAGQGTLGLELVEEAPDARTVVVPVGGGGLISGVGVALAALRPDVRLVGVQAAGAAARASLAAGRPVTVPSVRTIADGIAVKAPSPLTLAHLSAHVDEVVTVTDEEITAALLLLLERAKQLVEPAAAAALAAVLSGAVADEGPVAVVLSGGNVDPLVLTKLVERGLAVSGRYARIRILLGDRPGGLAGTSRILADLGLNVIEVDHHRTSLDVGVDEVALFVTVETRGPTQVAEAVGALQAAGYRAELSA